MNLSQLKNKVKALRNLAQNPGTLAEGQAAALAIERLKQKLDANQPELEHGVDYEAIILGPVLTSQKSCPWKDKLFYALCMHCSCIPFLTWEDVRKTRTDRLFKYYTYGSEKNTCLVMILFKSLTEQISQEVRKSKPAIHRCEYESFKRGLVDKLFDTLVPKHLRKTFSTTDQSTRIISKFAQEKNVHYSFIFLPNTTSYFMNSFAAESLGHERASSMSLDSLLAKPKP
jgi:hypothetical protein